MDYTNASILVVLVVGWFVFYLFIFGYAGSLLLCRLFSSCSEPGLLFIALRRLLVSAASFVVEHRLKGTELQ